MARALLTPDELRRLDNDTCIIYEKGLKPIKARKYYYFENSTVKIAKNYPADHNDVSINRGKWRKYNPYNPYEEEKGETENTQIESLDDLFADDDKAENKVEKNKDVEIKDEAPMLPQEEIEEQEQPKKTEEFLSEDIQKELEDKFDELFGKLDEGDSSTKKENSEESSDPFADIMG